MIATSSYFYMPASPCAHPHLPFHHQPARPSPLSPRSGNERPLMSPCIFTMASANPDNAIARSRQSKFSKRAAKPNPLIHRSSDQVKECRRDLFLKRVQQDREEKRWDMRSDQIMRLDFLAQQKRWRAEQERNAPIPVTDEDLEQSIVENHSNRDHRGNDMDIRPSMQMISPSTCDAEQEVDAVQQQEDAELDALIAMMEESNTSPPGGDDKSSHYGSDDDDCHQIFSDLAGMENAAPEQFGGCEEDAMDMSFG
ncbi:hypothetical protein BDY21DRAFT_87791 [Lineolata rhizophorae]|uniref:Uncharacterized protein n=1 Tax=Lineolata rhizophorae TaxID=578093 RepID=A0A6A6PCG4_9PEZI|nr:hypothetical protein BDY21DRAFT_87791 [Lineolata rhizophorae]